MLVCSEAGCSRKPIARGFCHTHYRKFLRNGGARKVVMNRQYGLTDDDRFLSYVDKGPRCWEWTGYRNAKGYGVMNIRGQRVLAHRFAYERIAEIPTGMCVLHHCDNPACVKFKHLFLGTKAENNADMDEKKRANRVGWPRGEGNRSARLNEEIIREIRASTEGSVALSAKFGVSRFAIWAIRKRRSWAHID